ncbi:MAG: GNAT family N-acetyltransferase [Candidatus Latescibacteria bacterium]|nr:GNAT family N-acetyltransferase [Candidatus Latescibacterota bacterium]
MPIELLKAQEKDRPIINNLAMFYSYDISEYADSTWYQCRENGLFEGGCDRYFEQRQTSIFTVRANGELAGFALVSQLDEPGVDFTVSEFFILRRFRKRNIGTYVARTLFDTYNGRWDVMVYPLNTTAVAFWRKTVSAYTGGTSSCALEPVPRYEGLEMYVHRFDNSAL